MGYSLKQGHEMNGFSLKQGQGVKAWAAHHHQNCPQVPPPPYAPPPQPSGNVSHKSRCTTKRAFQFIYYKRTA